MPRFRKKIVSQGVYEVADLNRPGTDPATGLPFMRQELISPARIRHWASEGNRYLATAPNGVPAPWTHIDPTTGKPIVLSDNGTLPRADLNGGWVKSFSVEQDPDLGTVLVGEIEAEGDENDPNTPAGKIGKTVRETSIFAAPRWQAGGEVFTDVPLHVAMVTHPIQTGQPNFERVPAGFTALAMSNMTYRPTPLSMAAPPPSSASQRPQPSGQGAARPTGNPQARSNPGNPNDRDPSQSGTGSSPLNASTADIGQILDVLRQCGIDLPDDTSHDNLLERLLVAARQKATSEGTAGGDLYQPPEGAMTQQPAPVAMSAPTFDFTTVTKEVFMSHPGVKALVDANNMLVELVTSQARGALQGRITKLLGEGKITQKYADEALKPLIEGFAMSQMGKSPIELTLTAIEAQPAIQTARQVHQQNAYNPSLLLGTAMSHPGSLAGESLENPFIQAADGSSGAGLDSTGKPIAAIDIVKQFFEATGGPFSNG